jgi:uncharacterized protein involved in tolerance to divalent cations
MGILDRIVHWFALRAVRQNQKRLPEVMDACIVILEKAWSTYHSEEHIDMELAEMLPIFRAQAHTHVFPRFPEMQLAPSGTDLAIMVGAIVKSGTHTREEVLAAIRTMIERKAPEAKTLNWTNPRSS